MQGADLHSSFLGGLSVLSVFTFQWVPALVISLYAGGNSALAGSTTPLTTPMTFGQMSDYLQNVSAPANYQTFLTDWGLFAAVSIFVSLLLLSIIIYCAVRIEQVRRFEELRFKAMAHPVTGRDVSRAQMRWRRIIDEINGESEQGWRLAILEADIMLNELLDNLGYKGETMADKMRQVSRSQFNSIDDAWEAHRARNKIAHEGSNMPLSQREAQHVINLYERVFREFQFIE